MDKLMGVIVPLVTPCDANGRVLITQLKTVVRHVIEGGVDGILAFGSNGEFYAIGDGEQERGLEAIVEETAGRVPVYMGVGATSTRACVELARMGERLGASAISVLPPMFLAPSDEELLGHVSAIADAVGTPVLLYNNPGRVGYGIGVPLLLKIIENVQTVVGIKDSSGNMTLTAEYIRLTRGADFRVFAGKDTLILASLAYGAAGCVASTANVVPAVVREIGDKLAAGDLSAARDAQYRLNKLRMLFDKASFPVATKDCMRLMGLDVGSSVLPNTTSSPALIAELKSVLVELGAVKP